MRRPLSLAASSRLTHVLTPLMLFEEQSFSDRDSSAIIKAEKPEERQGGGE